MSEIIKLLPDSVANQIAAGEVIQRPASVVKELVENSVDAGADSVKVVIKDAGRTLIQVIDNGCGMSFADSRMAFERHATSKIQRAEDLFSIRTFGFRGEALASACAVAHVELKTKRKEDELGSFIEIAASEIKKHEPCSCPDGSNFIIRNLFYNIPARRKFLKSNTTELRHIIEEFQRIAMTHPDVAMLLIHNDVEVFNLPASNQKQRIVNIIGKSRNQALLPLKTETSIVKISGFISKPEYAKRTSGEQYFFVNGRFMKHPGFYKAVSKAYEKILPPEMFPSFFIYLDVNTNEIDVNIHPTKTEIKFENEQAIWQFLLASVKESLGKNNIVPTLDFDQEMAFSIPVLKKSTQVDPPTIEINPNFNPFEEGNPSKSPAYHSSRINTNWETLYEGLRNESGFEDEKSSEIPFEKSTSEEESKSFFQLKNSYILTQVKSGMMIIDQKRAHERILFEKFAISLQNRVGIAQRSLFPIEAEFSADDFELLKEIQKDLMVLGFQIDFKDNNKVNISATPADMSDNNPISMLESFLETYKSIQGELSVEIFDNIACSLAKAASINYGKKLTQQEMRELFDGLFACTTPNYSSDGKTVIIILTNEEIGQRLG